MKKMGLQKLGVSILAASLIASSVVRAEEPVAIGAEISPTESPATQPAPQPETQPETTNTSADAGAITTTEGESSPAADPAASDTENGGEVNVNDAKKFSIDFAYEDFENLPEEVKVTLPKKIEFDSYFQFFLYNVADPKPVDLGDVYWEFVSYDKKEEVGKQTVLYTGKWEKKKKVNVSFSTNLPEGLPQEYRDKKYDSVKVVEGKVIPTPENMEIADAGKVWTLTWPKENAGKDDMAIIGTWVSRPLSFAGSVTFITKNGNQVVKFNNPDEQIGKRDDENNTANNDDAGGGRDKAYFIGWSTVPNYNGRQKDAKVFYHHEAISRAFPNGFKGGEKLYAFYFDVASIVGLGNKFSGNIIINKKIGAEETLYNKFAVKESKDAKKVFFIDNNVEKVNLVNLGASYELNPYMTAVVRRSSYYHHPGNIDFGAPSNDDFILNPLNMGNLKEKIKDNATKYTYVDLHVKVDSRIELAKQVQFSFKSYAFRPVVILKGDYSAVLDSVINTPDENPVSTITLNTNGEKEFIIRTRIRPKASIPNATAEEALQDMELVSTSDQNFTVAKEHLVAIARGEQGALKINGHVQGGANLYETTINLFGASIRLGGPTNIPKHTAETNILDFKPALVHFDLNAPKGNGDQSFGSVRVALNGNIDEDVFDRDTKPVYNADPTMNVIGEAMPKNPSIPGYTFEGYNTKADGSGATFTGTTLVRDGMLTSGEMTVYAQWSVGVSFDKNTVSLKDKQKQDLGTVDVLYNYPFRRGIVRGAVPSPSLAGYEFKGWNSKADGKGETLDMEAKVTAAEKYYAIWEPAKRQVPNTSTK